MAADEPAEAAPAPVAAPAPFPPAGPRPGDGLERVLVRAGLRVAFAVGGVVVLAVLAWRLRLLLLLIAAAVFIALLLLPLVRLLERRGLRRPWAVAVVYLVLVLGAASFGYLLFHPVYSSATRFASDLPSIVRRAEQGKGTIGRLVVRFHIGSYVAEHAPALESAISKLGKPALSVGKTVLSGVAGLVTIGFLSFFLLLEGPTLERSLLSLANDDQAAFARRLLERLTSQVAGFMLGDFATSVVCGIVVFVALRVTNVPFASVIAIWAGFVDFLPLVGGLLAGVPAVGLAFLHSIPAGVVTAVVFLVYQQVENHVLYPLIISRTVQLNALLVLLAVLLGAEVGDIVGSTFGAMCGAIFAVPAAGVAQLTVIELVAQHRARRVGRERLG